MSDHNLYPSSLFHNLNQLSKIVKLDELDIFVFSLRQLSKTLTEECKKKNLED